MTNYNNQMTNYNNQMADQQIDIDENVNVNPEPEIENVNITPEPAEPESTVGVVVDCSRLNVRTKPRADAEVVCVIERDSEVMIDEENSTKNFYKICTAVGAEGYCMKQFISISK